MKGVFNAVNRVSEGGGGISVLSTRTGHVAEEKHLYKGSLPLKQWNLFILMGVLPVERREAGIDDDVFDSMMSNG